MNKACKTLKKAISGFKGFLYGLRCHGNAKYELDKIYEKEVRGNLAVCTDSGYHFCRKAEDTWYYYPPVRDGLPSVYADVTIPKGALVADDENKSIANKIRVGNTMNASGFAQEYFTPIGATNIGYGMAISEEYHGNCTLESGLLLVGACVQQFLHSPSYTFTAYGFSCASADVLSVTVAQSSLAQSAKYAVSIYGAATAGFMAIGNTYASVWGSGVAVVMSENGCAKGTLGSLLVFLNDRNPQAFKVDGIKVKAGTLYTLCNGCLCEVEPYRDLAEGSL